MRETLQYTLAHNSTS